MPLLSLLPLLGWSIFLHRRLSITASYSLMLAVSGWLLIAFVGGLFGVIWPVSVIVWFGGIIVLLVQLPALRRHRHQRQSNVVYPLFVTFCVLFWFVHATSQYAYYDEYSHWGVFIKEMWSLDAFWNADSNSLHDRYPPGAPVWQYTFSLFSPKLDSSAYFAQFVLLITPLMVLWERLQWRQMPWIGAVVIAVVIGLANFGHGIASLYVDHLISTWLFGSVAIVVIERSDKMSALFLLALPLLVISLLKDAGIAFALAGATIIAVVGLVYARRADKRWSRSVGLSGLLLAVLLAPSVLALGAWSHNRDTLGIEAETQSLGGIVSGLIDDDQVLTEEQSLLIKQRFGHVFTKQQLSKDEVSAQYNAFSVPMADQFTDRWRLTTSSFYLAYALFFMLLISTAMRPQQRLTWGLLAVGLLGAALSYSVVLYLSYLFAFGERGLILSSYIRYTHTAVLAMYLLAIAALLPVARSFQRPLTIRRFTIDRGALVLAGILAWMMIFETPYLRSFIQENPKIAQRLSGEPVLQDISRSLGTRHLWVFFPNDQPNGFFGELIQFQLSPTPTEIERSEKFFDQPRADIRAQLAAYDVLWLPVANDKTDTIVEQALGLQLLGRFIEVNQNADGKPDFRILEF